MGAPDLAITQLLVDTLVVVLVVGLVIYMPGFADFIEKGQKTRRLDALLGILLGTVFSLLLLAVVSEPFNRRISAFYESAAFPEGHGRNIVNVILVDFRAFDTFGEVAVIIIAAIAAYALLVGARARKERE
jgi:multicomponent Na+:H+ antiporter subunit A